MYDMYIHDLGMGMYVCIVVLYSINKVLLYWTYIPKMLYQSYNTNRYVRRCMFTYVRVLRIESMLCHEHY